MKEKPVHPLAERFPILSLFLIFLLLFLIVVTSNEVRLAAVDLKRTYDNKSEMANLTGQILTYDEVLTMSTYMSVSTQDPRWEARYREHEPLLESVIIEAMLLDQEMHVAKTQEANSRLVEIEREAFELVRSGRAQDGRALLESDAYREGKKDYSFGITTAMRQLEASLAETVREETTSMRTSIILLVLLALLSLGIWGMLVHNLIRWRSMLLTAEDARRKANEELQFINQDLEQRISARTQEVRAQHDALHDLTKQMLEVEEQERVRLSSILHDELQQVLVTVQLRLGAHAAQFPATSRRELNDIASLVRSGIQTTRSLSSSLNPAAYSNDIFSALRHLTLRHRETMALTVELDVTEEIEQPSASIQQLLLRSTTEMLFNITKHAQTNAALVELSMTGEGVYRLVVQDNGVGIGTGPLNESMGLGLLSIRQRAEWLGGSLHVENVEPTGTRLTLCIPTGSPQRLEAV